MIAGIQMNEALMASAASGDWSTAATTLERLVLPVLGSNIKSSLVSPLLRGCSTSALLEVMHH